MNDIDPLGQAGLHDEARVRGDAHELSTYRTFQERTSASSATVKRDSPLPTLLIPISVGS
jgi:hypothetical protein